MKEDMIPVQDEIVLYQSEDGNNMRKFGKSEFSMHLKNI